MWTGNVLTNDSFESSHRPSDRLIIKSAGRVIFVPVHEIDWIEASANYVRLHLAGGTSHLWRQPIGKIAEQLDSSRFVRIHRSFIVNVSSIEGSRAAPPQASLFVVEYRTAARYRYSLA